MSTTGVLLTVALAFVALAIVASLFFAGPVARALLALGRRLAGLRERHFEDEDGAMRYLEGGRGHAVVLVHGFGGDAENWLFLARGLKKRFRVLAPDLPGLGSSPAPADGRLDVASQARRLARFVEGVAGEPVHLAGNSMGGQIATLLAHSRPELVRSLALLDPLGVEDEAGVPPSEAMRRHESGANVLLPATAADFDEMLELLFCRRPWLPGVLRRHYAALWLARRDANEALFRQISEAYVPLRPLLSALRLPLLVIWGAEDRILPAGGAQVFAAGAAHAQVEILSACGHLPMIEQPGPTLRRYLDFLEGAETASISPPARQADR